MKFFSGLSLKSKIIGLVLLLLVTVFSIGFFVQPRKKAETTGISFNQDVRPILNKRCNNCHGGVKQNGGLSLLFRDNALKGGDSGIPTIVPGNPAGSELIRRVIHSDPEERMPLEADPLSEAEVAILTKWIEMGAPWEQHWAFIPPVAPTIPEVGRRFKVHNPIDNFVAEKLKALGVAQSPEADRATLLRRVSLDLTGLPPTTEELQAFLKDGSPDAYEKVVDRLLASPRFGERWAAWWLDLARYGDSQGYQKDRPRQIWQYRDWVINAFNEDLPFDRFTVEQLAGDLLPQPTVDQLIATAFHRNTMTNDEGGTDDEEYRVVAVIDRVNTTFEVWQGLTFSCIQCHSHPYDPFPHKDFYQAYAYFNNTADADRTDEYPTLKALSSIQIRQIEEIKKTLQQESDTNSASYRAFKTQLAGIKPSKTPIIRELPLDSSRTNFLFERGNWLVHGEEVQPNVPGVLNTELRSKPGNRLELAKWLTDPNNPLTARVMVNRFWEQIFGLGIVETVEDFGTQGAKPSHPELLDWLALQYAEEGDWSTKRLLKTIVMSATYRQQSAIDEEKREKDPYNKYLSRGPRVRLSAEQVRDQALLVAGLLSDKMYGPSVMPPQPEGVWQVIRNVLRWKPSKGEDRYRRALYTYWRKSSPYPSFLTFDAPTKELCQSRRIRTNTPLQALVTLNDSVHWEAAQGLALHMQAAETGKNPEKAIAAGYTRALMHSPETHKMGFLLAHYDKALRHFQQEPDSVKEYLTLTPQGDADLAALTSVASVILNLDEFITKE